MILKRKSNHRGSRRVAGIYGRRIGIARNVFLLFVVLCLGLWCLVTFVEPIIKGERSQPNSADVYLVVQMLFANGGEKETSGPILKWARLVAPWILPILGVYAVVTPLRVRLGFFLRAILCRHHDLVLVIGLGQKGMEMVRAELGRPPSKGPVLASRRTSVVVIEPDEENPYIVQAETEGAQVWIGDGSSLADLTTASWKRPSRIWIMTGNSRRNLLILDMLSQAYSQESAPRIEVHALVSEFKERRDAMRLQKLNRDHKGCWTYIFNQEEAIAEWMIRQNPVAPVNGQPPRILLVGMGPLGRATLRELLLMCHFPDLHPFDPGRMPQIVMVDSHEVFKVLDEELPFFIESNCIDGVCPFVRQERLMQDAQAWVFERYRDHVRKGNAFTHVFICMGSEVRNLALAERVLGWEMLLGASEPIPRIVPVVYDDEAADWSGLGVGNESIRMIHPFQVSSIYTPEALQWRNDVLQGMAQRINHVYNLTDDPLNKEDSSSVWAGRVSDLSKEGRQWRQRLTERVLASVHEDADEIRRKALEEQAWQASWEDDRRSSLAQARYIFNRFYLAGQSAGDMYRNTWSQTLPSSGPEGVRHLDLEARCEHRRWNAFMLVENFGRVPLEKVQTEYAGWEAVCDAKYPEDEGGTKLRKFARVNLNLMPFDNLPDKFKRMDLHLVAGHDWIERGKAALS